MHLFWRKGCFVLEKVVLWTWVRGVFRNGLSWFWAPGNKNRKTQAIVGSQRPYPSTSGLLVRHLLDPSVSECLTFWLQKEAVSYVGRRGALLLSKGSTSSEDRTPFIQVPPGHPMTQAHFWSQVVCSVSVLVISKSVNTGSILTAVNGGCCWWWNVKLWSNVASMIGLHVEEPFLHGHRQCGATL